MDDVKVRPPVYMIDTDLSKFSTKELEIASIFYNRVEDYPIRMFLLLFN
jgi:hypothetical protein